MKVLDLQKALLGLGYDVEVVLRIDGVEYGVLELQEGVRPRHRAVLIAQTKPPLDWEG